MTSEQRARITVLRCQGKSYMQISRTLGIPKDTVSTFCRRNGLSGTADKSTVLCKQCGRPIKLTPKCRPKKFCSDACRVMWWNSHPDRVNRKAVYHFVCAYCGEAFSAYGNAGRKYCSHACYISDRFGKERGCHE